MRARSDLAPDSRSRRQEAARSRERWPVRARSLSPSARDRPCRSARTRAAACSGAIPGPLSRTSTRAAAPFRPTRTSTSGPPWIDGVLDQVGEDSLDASRIRLHNDRLGLELHGRLPTHATAADRRRVLQGRRARRWTSSRPASRREISISSSTRRCMRPTSSTSSSAGRLASSWQTIEMLGEQRRPRRRAPSPACATRAQRPT